MQSLVHATSTYDIIHMCAVNSIAHALCVLDALLTWVLTAVEGGWLRKGDEGWTRNAMGRTVDAVWQCREDSQQLHVCMHELHNIILYCTNKHVWLYEFYMHYCLFQSLLNYRLHIIVSALWHRRRVKHAHIHYRIDHHSPTHPLESNLSLGKIRGKREYWHFSCMPCSDLPNWVIVEAGSAWWSCTPYIYECKDSMNCIIQYVYTHI